MLTVNWQAELLFISTLCSKLSENSYANQALIIPMFVGPAVT